MCRSGSSSNSWFYLPPPPKKNCYLCQILRLCRNIYTCNNFLLANPFSLRQAPALNLQFICTCWLQEGTRWCSWSRHCATSRKVAGSIPDGVIGIFHWHNPSGRTMVLGLTQPLSEMSTGNISWGLRRPLRSADNLTTIMCRLYRNLGTSTSWNPQGLSRPVMGLLLLTVILKWYKMESHFCTQQNYSDSSFVWTASVV